MGKPPPSILLTLLLALLIGIFLGGAAFALKMPNLGINVDIGPKGQLLVVTIHDPSRPIALPATLTAISSVKNPAQRIALSNDHHLIVETQTAPKMSSIIDQDRLVAMAHSGPVNLELIDARGQAMVVQRAATGYNSLTPRFWLLGLAGLTCAFISAWVFVLRPSLFAAQVICLIGVSLLGVSLPIAVTFAGDFIIGGSLWMWAQTCNYVFTQVFAAAVLTLLLQYPQKIISEKASFWVLIGVLAPIINLAFQWPNVRAMFDYVNVVVLLDLLLITIAAVLQWRATRRDPIGRSYIQLVGATWVIVLSVWVSLNIVPVYLGGTPLIDFAASIWLMVPPFFAMAYGVAKGFMFEASTWAGRLLLSAMTLLMLIGVDLALVYAVGLDSGTAASGAFFIIGTSWFLARNALAARFLGKDMTSNSELFDQAVGVAMARDDAERASKWQAALKAIFDPLDIQLQTQQDFKCGVVSGGLGMSVPALRFTPPMLLTSKRAGTQVFTGSDVKTVETLTAMCDRIDTDRDAYERGTQAERGRIARDLHDDVSSRLLTSLHRTQSERVQADVREALSDIRSIIAGLDGERQQIGDVLSAIRIDVVDRLEAAGIEASWPLHDETTPVPIMVDYRIYRNLNATMREIASNIVRHAKATHVEVNAKLIADAVNPLCHIDIRDNGIGLDIDHKKGNGLTNIVSRMTEIGGTVIFAITAPSDAQRGMNITLELPLPPYNRGTQSDTNAL